VQAALTFGRSEDLDHARRLIAGKPVLEASDRATLGDADAELGSVGR
jgi:hypothetical protein